MRLTLFCRHSSQIADLQEQVRWLRDRCDIERVRAQLAVDALLAMRVGAPPITPPEPPRHETAEQVAARLLMDREFADAGSA
jgi:hypothetical protein